MNWISVMDHLPEAGEVVIVWVKGYLDIAWFDVNHALWRTDLAIYQEREITHWMPLPEPPKEEK